MDESETNEQSSLGMPKCHAPVCNCSQLATDYRRSF